MKNHFKSIIIVIICLVLCCFLFHVVVSAYTIPWRMDNSKLQNELYDIIGTAENQLVPGNNHSDEYLITMNKTLPLAADVYNNLSSSDEDLKNAIKGVKLAIDGADYTEVLNCFNTSTNATEAQNPTTVISTETPTQEPIIPTEPPINDNYDEFGFPKFDANVEVVFGFDNTETQMSLYELIVSVDNMFAPGNDYSEDYRSKVILIRNVAATVYNDNSSSETELQNAIIGLQMAIDDKALSDIAKYFGNGSHNKRGDADGDGEITILDVTYIQRSELGIILPTPILGDAADVDGDGFVNVIDATLLQRHLVGIPTLFNIGGYI